MNKNEILKKYFGHEVFREGQSDLIDRMLSGRDVFGIMPTGAGKSICYQIPALMLDGITLVISPLISLMKDQVASLVQAGIKAAYINSSLTAGQYREVMKRAAAGMYKIIYVAPERLATEEFIRFAEETKIAMVTVDEAHCVSQWGQDFRPSYLKIIELFESLSYRPIISAFTATATEEVRADIILILRLKDPFIVITSFDRKNLYYEVQKPDNKLASLLGIVKRNKEKSGIIYCATRKTVEMVCDTLNEGGFPATRYHAGLSNEERQTNQDDFIYDRKPVMVATNAFGMGIDKSNVSFVVHYNMPKNIESYYQEAGRAGRDGEDAECILLYSSQDVATNRFLIDNERERQNDQTEEMCRLVKQKDRERLKEMTFYCATTDCLREYILRYFGESASHFCGNCINCNTHFETVDVTTEAQKIVSCVHQILQSNRRFGKAMITDILHGSCNDKVKRSGMDRLSAYGSMPDTPVRKIRSILDFLIENGTLLLSDDEYPVVMLSGRSEEILFDEKKIEMKCSQKSRPEKAKKDEPAYSMDDKLFFVLKVFRNQLAVESHVPSYIIFTDAALRDMVRKLPQTKDEFLEVSGVGAAKLERYGQRFMKLIQEYRMEHPE